VPPGAVPSARRRPRSPVPRCPRSGSSPSSGRSLVVAWDHGKRWSRPHGPAGSAAPSPPGPRAAPPGPRSRPGRACPWGTTSRHRPAGGPGRSRPRRPGHGARRSRRRPARPPRSPAAAFWVERAGQAVGHRSRVSAAAVRSIPVNSSSVKASGPDRLRWRLRSRRHHWLSLGPHRLVHQFSLSLVRRARRPCVPTVSAGAGGRMTVDAMSPSVGPMGGSPPRARNGLMVACLHAGAVSVTSRCR
jgi:hypothetical protein